MKRGHKHHDTRDAQTLGILFPDQYTNMATVRTSEVGMNVSM